jgi:hypothetical protein
VRIPVKDKANDCGLFLPRVTVAREGTSNGAGPQVSNPGPPVPRNPEDARSAFDKLFKKT